MLADTLEQPLPPHLALFDFTFDFPDHVNSCRRLIPAVQLADVAAQVLQFVPVLRIRVHHHSPSRNSRLRAPSLKDSPSALWVVSSLNCSRLYSLFNPEFVQPAQQI